LAEINNTTVEEKIPLDSRGQTFNILGHRDENLALIEQSLPVKLVLRDQELVIKGEAENVQRAKRVLEHLQILAQNGINITTASVNYALNMSDVNEEQNKIMAKMGQTIYVNQRGKQIRAKTIGQYNYLQALTHSPVTFVIGPAGTGKTYLAVVMAIAALKARKVGKIILARPAVEAGEKLGFLPGDLQDKVNPYLRPVYDALNDVLGPEAAARQMERGNIEVVPLAYMRGRTLDEAFIILDEAQNTTPQQMKMFLTRMGVGSQAVINGDITQIDLPAGQVSGLIDAERLLKNIEGLSFCYLTQVDVLRHPLVQKIIDAYERKSALPAESRE